MTLVNYKGQVGEHKRQQQKACTDEMVDLFPEEHWQRKACAWFVHE